MSYAAKLVQRGLASADRFLLATDPAPVLPKVPVVAVCYSRLCNPGQAGIYGKKRLTTPPKEGVWCPGCGHAVKWEKDYGLRKEGDRKGNDPIRMG